MPTVYLFRFDGAKDNDDFFNAMRPSVGCAYAGMELSIGAAGWIPDLLKVEVHEPPESCSLALIELEATESAALISCKKYLPENSASILSAFNEYLDRVIRECRSSADPREGELANLKSVLSEASHVTITTAGALRSSTAFVEELFLIDQPKRPAETPAFQPQRQANPLVFMVSCVSAPKRQKHLREAS
jgi:hypothetical protein